jgi:hypothetical protein
VFSFHLRIEAANHHCLDVRQEFRADECVEPERLGHREGRIHVEPQDCAGDDAQLAREPQGQIPDLPTLNRDGAVQDGWAFAAGASTGSAILVAPAEMPLGKGAESFFSASSSRPFET